MTTITHPFHVPARWHLAPTVTGAALVAGTAVGVLAWAHQLAGGLAETGLNSVVPWGLYTVLFTFFVSATAGALALACAGILAPGSPLAGLVRSASGVAVAGAAAALLTVVVNLARPERAANLVLHPNWSTPSVWQLYGVLATLALAVVLAALRGRQAPHSVALRLVSVAGLLAALALPVLTSWVFTVPLGQATWNDPLLSPVLLASSAVAGVALAALAALALTARGHADPMGAVRGRLATLLLTALGVTFLLTALGYVTALTGGSKERALVAVVLPGGSWAWSFWTQWLAGGLAAVLLLLPRLRPVRAALGVAMAAAALAVLALYVSLIPAGEVTPPVSLPPGTAPGRWAPNASSFVQVGSYSPSWTEYGVAVGLLTVFVAVLLLAHGRDARGDRG